MALLKKLFPYSFGMKDVASLVIRILIYLVIGFVIGFLIGILAKIPVLGIIFGLLGGLLDLYVFAAIVIACLDFFKVLK